MIEVHIGLPLARFALQIDLRLGRGVTALMGPSGSGKTSLLEAVAGLRRRATGRIEVDGNAWLDSSKGIRLPPEARRVGYVPQDAGLFPHLTALGNVRFGAKGEHAAAETAIDTLEIRGLRDRYPVSLSGGEKQRVALARALAARPRLLLLDEPLASLDAALRERILPYLVRIRDDWKIPCLYVTHNVGEALAMAERLVLLRDGAIEAEGRPIDLLATPTMASEAARGIDNLLAGQIQAHDPEAGVTQVSLRTGLTVFIPLAADRALGAQVTLAIRAEDILVATESVRGLSARNIYPARVTVLERTGVDVTIRCAPDADPEGQWLVRVTPAAVAALALGAGSRIWLAVKSHSVRLV